MSLHSIRVGSLTIPAAGTDSPALSSDDIRDSDFLTIFAPATLPEAVNVQVSWLKVPAAGDWRDLRRNAADVTIAAGDAETIDGVSFNALRLHAGGAVAADRAFQLVKGVWA